MINLEVGRTYRSQSNEHVTILKQITPENTEPVDRWYYKLGFIFKGSTGRYYRPNGQSKISNTESSDILVHLIEEIVVEED